MARNNWQKAKLCGMMCIVLLALLVSCSTKKNTSTTRAYHALTAHYNTLYNGQVAFREGEEAQNTGHKEDYTRLLPIFVSTNKTTANIGRSNFETAVAKSEKAIKVHSIKKRPTIRGNKRRTPKQKAYLRRSSVAASSSRLPRPITMSCAYTAHSPRLPASPRPRWHAAMWRSAGPTMPRISSPRCGATVSRAVA